MSRNDDIMNRAQAQYDAMIPDTYDDSWDDEYDDPNEDDLDDDEDWDDAEEYPDDLEPWETEPDDSYPGGVYAAPFNPEQKIAVGLMLDFIADPEGSYFLLSGAAGTGKTYCIKYLIENTSKKVVFTAPTNKATKVLRETLTTEDYQPICRTIYSLLGLKLEPSGKLKKLVAPENPIDLKDHKIIVIDEASMVNAVLWKEIQAATENFKLKIIFMGDSNQLPPISEKASLIWQYPDIKAELLQVMRFDNQILELAERIKNQVNHPAPTISLLSNNDEIEGVWKLEESAFRAEIIRQARLGNFSRSESQAKAIAWRNITVDSLNRLIRAQLFDNSSSERWLPGDRVLLTAPANDVLKDGKQMIGHTDDEGAIERIAIGSHPKYSDFKCYNISLITDENKRISLWVLHPDSSIDEQIRLHNLANDAKLNPRKWRDYWQFKDAFHSIKHAYAITAHRAQGSTYDTAFVVWNDILLNRNRGEAYRCLYVACTRPKKRLYLGRV
jgi:exodeoxyribonuclease-5